MEKEKMIEEMVKVTCGYKVHCNRCQKVHPTECVDRYFARTFYDAGYRKVPEGAVVLTREQFEEFRKDDAHVKYLKGEIRKETAREILNDISKAIKYEEDIHGLEYHIIIGKEEVFKLKKKLKEKYGVEVEE